MTLLSNRLLFYGVLFCLCALAWGSLLNVYILHKEQGRTRVVFFDVGQGDAILISEGHQQILIDGGPDGVVLLERLGKSLPLWDKRIDAVIATHADKDHIDGLIDIVRHYTVSSFFAPHTDKSNEITQALENALDDYGVERYDIARGYSFVLNSGARLDVIYPLENDQDHDDENRVSVAAILTIGSEKFFLGGDLPKDIEERLPLDESIDVLKVSHHGSATSTSEFFVDKIAPRDAIISAGADNRYGHPHPDVIDRLQNYGTRIFRTDEQGSITYVCTHDSQACEIVFE